MQDISCCSSKGNSDWEAEYLAAKAVNKKPDGSRKRSTTSSSANTKRKTTAKRRTARRKNRAQDRMPAGLGTLFAGLLLLVLAFVLALAAGRWPVVEVLLRPYVLAIKAVPVASFIILALIWFGSRNLSVFIALVMVLPVMYTNVLSGIRARDGSLLEMARVFKIPALRRIRCIDLPQVMPYFRTGCTVGLGLCWKAGVAAEVIGMPVNSIGERLQQAKVYLDTPELFAWTVVIVCLSVGVEKLFGFLLMRLERRLTRL